MKIHITAVRFYIFLAIFLTFSHGSNAHEVSKNHNDFFDFEHIQSAIKYLTTPSNNNLKSVANSNAMKHLKNHSDRTGYYSKTTSIEEIALDLLTNKKPTPEKLIATQNLVDKIAKNKEKQQYCLNQTLQYLPSDFTFSGHLYFTWGYDIGVSMDTNASLNLAHKTFHKSIDEVWYYCIHELNHVGFQQYHQFPDLAKITTGKQLFELVQYLTVLEGSAVYSAYEARAKNNALTDPDYIALKNPKTMKIYTQEYFQTYNAIAAIGERTLNDEDWNLLNDLSDGKRLWYRVGAAMAQKLDKELGRHKYKSIIKKGPDAFFKAYKAL